VTLDHARRVFASHMAAARTRQLTAYEKRELTTARQMLRRSRRPAGLSKVNPKQKARRNSAKLCPTCGRSAGSPYRRADARGRIVQGCVDKFHTGHLTTPSESARWHGSREARSIRKNPSGLIRMGKLVEIRYERDHGAQKGYYRHPFKVRPVIYYRPSDNSILIKGGK